MTCVPTSGAVPFRFKDVRIALRNLLLDGDLTEQLAVDVLQMAKRYRSDLASWAEALRTNGRRAHRLRNAIFNSPSARITCFLLANGKKKNRGRKLTWQEVYFRAARINPRKPSGERVRLVPQRKRSGAWRFTCSFGPIARSAQRMLEHLILAGEGCSPYEYARRGRGREAAIKVGLHAIRQKGVRWFGTADVKDYFPSVSREMVLEVLKYVPTSAVLATIFIHEDTDIQSHKKTDKKWLEAIRLGLPQGSLASVLVASKVLQPRLAALKAPLVTVFIDNLLIGGKNEKEVLSLLDALASALQTQLPCGSLHLIHEAFQIGAPDLDYLGYRFLTKASDGEPYVRYSEAGRQRFCARTAFQMLLTNSKAWLSLQEHAAARWSRSLVSWPNRKGGEDLAFIHLVEDLEPAVVQINKMLHSVAWETFESFVADLHYFAKFASDRAPPLFSLGGPFPPTGYGTSY